MEKTFKLFLAAVVLAVFAVFSGLVNAQQQSAPAMGTIRGTAPGGNVSPAPATPAQQSAPALGTIRGTAPGGGGVPASSSPAWGNGGSGGAAPPAPGRDAWGGGTGTGGIDAPGRAVAAEQFRCCPIGMTCRRIMPPCPEGMVCATVMPNPWPQCRQQDTPVCCPDYTVCTRSARTGSSAPVPSCSSMFPQSPVFSCCPPNDRACLAQGIQPCSTLRTCCAAGDSCPPDVPRCNALGCCPPNARCTAAIPGATLPACYVPPHNPNSCCPTGSVCPPDITGRVPPPCIGRIEHGNPAAMPNNVTFRCTEPPMDPAIIAEARANRRPLPMTECEKLIQNTSNIIYIDVHGRVVGTSDAQSAINNPSWQMIIGGSFVPDYQGNVREGDPRGKADTPSGLIFDEFPQPQRSFENFQSNERPIRVLGNEAPRTDDGGGSGQNILRRR